MVRINDLIHIIILEVMFLSLVTQPKKCPLCLFILCLAIVQSVIVTVHDHKGSTLGHIN